MKLRNIVYETMRRAKIDQDKIIMNAKEIEKWKNQ